MSNTLNWSAEQLPGLLPGSAAPPETALDGNRISAVRDLVLMLLRELEALRPEELSQPDRTASLQTQVQQFESDLIRQALFRSAGNQARAARLLGVKHTTLNAKIHRYRICVSDQPRECETAVSDQVIVA
jgi:transcriptional regulator with GAF, ATPase, and Fis domain